MFTPEERAHLRVELLEFAARDYRISGAAVTGSAANEDEDQWSDIDLAFGVVDAAELPNVLSDWTARMYDQHLALHHLDVKSGAPLNGGPLYRARWIRGGRRSTGGTS